MAGRRHPYTDEALAAIKADGVQRLVVLPLYPQFSISTSGSSLRLLEHEYYQDQQLRLLKNVVIPAWYNRQGYVHSMARLIASRTVAASCREERRGGERRGEERRGEEGRGEERRGEARRRRRSERGAICDAALVSRRIDMLPEGERAGAHVFFSAHGLPQKYVQELGDPYQQQIEAALP